MTTQDDKRRSGHLLRAHRLAQGPRPWSQARLVVELERAARDLGTTTADRDSMKTQVSRWENGRITVGPEYRALFRAVYNATDEELGFPHPQPAAEELDLASTQTSQTEVSRRRPPGAAGPEGPLAGEDDEVRRRELLSLFAGATTLALTSDFGEDTRQGLERSLAIPASDRDLEEWERSIDIYGVELGSAPPTVMLHHLLADINDVNGLLGRQPSMPTHRRLLRVATQLSVLTAVTVISTGAPQAGRRWWRTARRLSEQVGDVELDTFVLAQQAVLAMYCGYDQEQVLALSDEALHASGRDLVCIGAASATAARAQALAVLGRADEARQALDHLRGLVDRLPDDVTAPSATWFAYPEYKLRHVESYVSTRIGRIRDAAQAQDAAIRLYPKDKYRGLSQVELHRAACLIMDGHVNEGITHATQTLHGLPASLCHDNLIRNVAQATVGAIPTAAQALPQAQDLRHMLALTSGTA